MDFDLAKSQTLLFFFEHIMCKGEPQKLRDLSCKFGDKAFTKEMRTFVGGSQGGKSFVKK